MVDGQPPATISHHLLRTRFTPAAARQLKAKGLWELPIPMILPFHSSEVEMRVESAEKAPDYESHSAGTEGLAGPASFATSQ